MRVFITDRGFNRERLRAQGLRAMIVKTLDPVVKEVATALDNGIDGIMPVKTGRAKASWGKYNPSYLVSPNPDSQSGDSGWEEGVMSVLQGTNVPYVEELNGGSSKKAPIGFIDSWALHAQGVLLRQVAAALEAL